MKENRKLAFRLGESLGESLAIIIDISNKFFGAFNHFKIGMTAGLGEKR